MRGTETSPELFGITLPELQKRTTDEIRWMHRPLTLIIDAGKIRVLSGSVDPPAELLAVSRQEDIGRGPSQGLQGLPTDEKIPNRRRLKW